MTVEELIELCIKYNLKIEQAIWMECKSRGVELPNSLLYLSNEMFNNLKSRSFIRGGELTQSYYNIVSTTSREPKKAVLKRDPQYDKVIELISRTLNPGDGESDREHKEKYTTALGRLDNNEALTNLFITWLYLFPTDGKYIEQNKNWTKLFGTTYKGVTLRRNTEFAADNFKKAVISLDANLFILSTFLFIKMHIRPDGECYIPKIENFFKEHLDWYGKILTFIEGIETERDLYVLFNYRTDESVAPVKGKTISHGSVLA